MLHLLLMSSDRIYICRHTQKLVKKKKGLSTEQGVPINMPELWNVPGR